MYWDTIEQSIRSSVGQGFRIREKTPISGGCINSAFKIIGNTDTDYFVKVNRPDLAWMFEAEALALGEILASQTVKTPQVICFGDAGDKSFLVLEWIALNSPNAGGERTLGQQLAAMHKVQRPFFGWDRNNAIGSTLQVNTPTDNWLEFWRDRRLGYQLKLAGENGYGNELRRTGEMLCDRMDEFFCGYQPRPSLLHGDLWGGNVGMDEAGLPFVFDPASYYGDREADIAMTELFGGFGSGFYAAYREGFPLDQGYSTRKDLYNLYHIINHLNLFGGGYLEQAQLMIERLLGELGL